MNPPSNWSRWSVVVLLMALAGLAHFNRIAISVAGAEVFIGKGGISETRMGWVYTAFLIVYTLGMIPGGWLIDRIGTVRALTLLGLVMGTFAGLTGVVGLVALTPLQLWISLLVIRSLAGLGNTPLHPGAAHVVSDVMLPSRRVTANGMVTAGALIGIAFCYPVFGMLIDRLTWPWAFFVSGAALVGFGVVWYLISSRHVPPHAPAVKSVPTNPTAITSGIQPLRDRSILYRRELWLISLSYTAFGYFQYLFFYWMDYSFKDVLHVGKVDARNDSFWITLAQGAGMVVGGLCSDTICGWIGVARGRRVIVMTGMGVGAIGALVAVSVQSELHVVLALAVAMGALGTCEGVFWTTATDIGGRNRGLVAAFMNTFGNAGGLVSPTLTPVLAQSSLGWPGAITVACAIVAAGGFVWCWITPLPARAAVASAQTA
jgi:ACS family D-galactonate transporter-like MFS transporter